MPAPDRVLHLVDHFHAEQAALKSGLYNETQARLHFINPLFAALGWDMDNRQKLPLDQCEVIHEDAIRVGATLKAPDYSFRIGGVRKFFVEAKQPNVNLAQNAAPAFQLRRYAWSASLPLSILTDFEEFAVYDCRYEPSQFDLPTVARVDYFRYSDYADRWDSLAERFSYDAVRAGSLDRYAEEVKAKKGALTVDKAFLREIERWRDLLARNLAQRNPGLDHAALNYAVQMTIDRLIFLRMAEDRAIEHYGRLKGAAETPNVYANLAFQFAQADARYNSGLFHFKPEAGREREDSLTLGLTIDDEPLRDIITHLYYPDSPYAFTVIPVELLGQVYEQFLGKVITLGPDHRAVVEEKPEVRKAGGVYYTPAYIVDYIVRHTLGPLLDGGRRTEDGGRRTEKSPSSVVRPSSSVGLPPSSSVTPPSSVVRLPPVMGGPPSPLRVLDPACGSGSFLLGAYDYLLDWYRDQYVADGPAKHKTRLRQAAGGGWGLTLAERKRVLLDHIYGVDLDPQAVEVTKLSLLLKVLEGETSETLTPQMTMFHDRALPDLSANIQCGNSLIGPDFLEGRPYDPDEAARVNPFDWHAAFPHVFAGDTPGFDAVIGNPPYIRIQTMKEWAPLEVEHYKHAYRSASKGNYDIYVVFVERGLSLLNQHGRLGFILPHKFFNSQYGEPIRSLLASGKYLNSIVHFGAQQVFIGATTYTCLLFLGKDASDRVRMVKVNDLASWRATGEAAEGFIPAIDVTGHEWNFTVGSGTDLVNKLKALPDKLGDVADIFVGLQTSADDVFIMDFVGQVDENQLKLRSQSLKTEWTFEKDLLYPLVSGTDVNRYEDLPERQYILFPYNVDSESVALIPLEVIERQHPQTAQYLKQNQERLENRENGKLKGGAWHGYIYLKNMRRQSVKKLCLPRLVDRLYATYDIEGNHFLDNVDVGGITLKQDYLLHDLRFMLGLLNSKLLRWYFPFVSAPFRGGWLSANRQFLSQLPIRTIDFGNSADKARHDQVVALVETMLDLHRRRAAAATPAEHTRLDRQIGATDQQIDRLVYDLYGLTDDEIRLVEAAG